MVRIKVAGTIEYLDDNGQVIESANAGTQRAVYLAWCRDHDVRPSGQPADPAGQPAVPDPARAGQHRNGDKP